MGLCATKKKYLDDEHDGEEREGIDEEALRESISHIDEFSHVLYANEEDMLKCFDFQNAKILSSGEKTDVYYVKYQNFHDHFVCKVEHFGEKNDEEFNHTLHESESLKLLSRTPNINKIRSTFEDPHRFYLMLEKYYGWALDQYVLSYVEIKKEGLPEEVCKFIMKGILLAVQKMHKLGVVHRQISLEHVLFKAHEEYLNEFKTTPEIGIISFNKSLRVFSETDGYTDLDAVVGCPGYVAPEIQQVEMGAEMKYNSECDIWSVGVIAYSLLCGTYPFEFDMENGEFASLVQKELLDFALDIEQLPGISDEAIDFVYGLLAVDPEERMTGNEAYNHEWIKSLDAELANSLMHKMYYEQKVHVYVEDFTFETKFASLLITTLLLTQKYNKNRNRLSSVNVSMDTSGNNNETKTNGKSSRSSKKRRKSVLETIGVVSSDQSNKSLYVGGSDQNPPSVDYKLVKDKALSINKYFSKLLSDGKSQLQSRINIEQFINYCKDEAKRKDIVFHNTWEEEETKTFFEDLFNHYITYDDETETILKLEMISSLLCLRDQLASNEISNRAYDSFTDIENEKGIEDMFDWDKHKDGIIHDIYHEVNPSYIPDTLHFQSSHLEYRYRKTNRGKEWFTSTLGTEKVEEDDDDDDEDETESNNDDDNESDHNDDEGENEEDGKEDLTSRRLSSIDLKIQEREEVVISTIAPWLANTRDHELTSKVQACFRGIKERKIYRKKRKAAITMQSNIRGYLQRSKV